MRTVKAGSERLYILIIELFSQRGQVCHHSQQSKSLRHQPFTEAHLAHLKEHCDGRILHPSLKSLLHHLTCMKGKSKKLTMLFW